MNTSNYKLKKLKTELDIIEEQNMVEDEDIAWDKSLAKKLILASLIYVAIGLSLQFSSYHSAWAYALVPALGFVIGSYIMEIVKRYWQEKIYKEKQSE